MKGIIFLAAAFGAIFMCTAIRQDQVDQLMDLNFMLDVVHKNFDHAINQAWDRQKHNMNVLNAQFLSRYGFNIEEMKNKEAGVLEAIERRGQEINNPNSECLQTLRSGLENAVGYANMNYQGVIEEIFFYFNQTNDVFFYPNVEIFHFDSNSFQWEILTALLDINPVADMDGLIQRILADYYLMLQLYEAAINTLDNDIIAYDREFNEVRRSTFHTFESVKAYFLFTCSMLADAVETCT